MFFFFYELTIIIIEPYNILILRLKIDITKHVFYQPTASYNPPPSGGPAVEPNAKNMLCSAADLSAKLLSV